MDVISFEGVVGMDAFRAKSVIRMKLAHLGYYDVDFTEDPFKKTQYDIKPYLVFNNVTLLIDEKFDEVTKTPKFIGRKTYKEEELW